MKAAICRAPIVVAIAFAFSGCTDDAQKRAKQAQDDAELRAKQSLVDAEKLANDWQPQLVTAAKEAKAEYEKLFPSKTEYDLVFEVPEEGSDKLKAHQVKLSKMSRLEVEGLTIGYEERKERSLGGKSYEKHFRATWIFENRVVGIGYYSKKSLDAVAFTELLRKLVPISNEVFRHVQLKRPDTASK